MELLKKVPCKIGYIYILIRSFLKIFLKITYELKISCKTWCRIRMRSLIRVSEPVSTLIEKKISMYNQTDEVIVGGDIVSRFRMHTLNSFSSLDMYNQSSLSSNNCHL